MILSLHIAKETRKSYLVEEQTSAYLSEAALWIYQNLEEYK